MPQLRHARPRVVDVRHAVAAQAGEIIALQELGVADLDGVAELRRQRGQERVQPVQKFAGIAKLRLENAPNSKISSAVFSR